VSHKTLVYFAVEWANYALQNYSKSQNPKVQNCIDLTRKWLQDHNSVSADQLKEAAYAAGKGKNKLNEQNRQGTFILKFFGME
jgi:hypothetical protein